METNIIRKAVELAQIENNSINKENYRYYLNKAIKQEKKGFISGVFEDDNKKCKTAKEMIIGMIVDRLNNG